MEHKKNTKKFVFFFCKTRAKKKLDGIKFTFIFDGFTSELQKTQKKKQKKGPTDKWV